MYDHERLAYGSPPTEGSPSCLSQRRASPESSTGSSYLLRAAWSPSASRTAAHCKKYAGTTRRPPPTNAVVKTFLDESTRPQLGALYLLRHRRSSLFFPTATPELIETLIATLALETPFPFIFALGDRLASVSAELIEHVSASGKGFICKFWVEQQAILQHSAVGGSSRTVTHGGFNSVSASLSQGVPLIVWPTDDEQLINATLLSSGADAVASTPVRSSASLCVDASAEFAVTFSAARGREGARLTANAGKLGRTLKETLVGKAADEIVRLFRF
ncbi:hypothetical protein FB451DRAFT_1526911 [Mycena latifolia]|nr:hypothetical protein FB451DRAFT_1526911 [Mycena latifolia]